MLQNAPYKRSKRHSSPPSPQPIAISPCNCGTASPHRLRTPSTCSVHRGWTRQNQHMKFSMDRMTGIDTPSPRWDAKLLSMRMAIHGDHGHHEASMHFTWVRRRTITAATITISRKLGHTGSRDPPNCFPSIVSSRP